MDPSTTFRRLVPVDRLVPRITPSNDVYVVAHMGIARVELRQWRLVVDGMVERPFELDYAALTGLPASEVTAVIECFGNPIYPEVPTRRVGNVVWRGVRLAELLAKAGVRPGTRYVCPEGLDHGSFANVESDCYVKDLPIARALEPDVLVAWEMNGAALTPEHGFPARVFVPGYFGTNSVKWLSRLTLSDERPESLFTTRLYNRSVTIGGRPVLEPVRELDVHAVIVAPAEGSALALGQHTIKGWAWSAWEVRAVDVSTDGGVSWQAAELGARPVGHEWQPFALVWKAEVPGRRELQVRATDAQERVQPRAGRNRIHSINVTVS
jgi:DMSO/TMAO reductase YedYZ molybdopterin-dependent catalytic subunit